MGDTKQMNTETVTGIYLTVSASATREDNNILEVLYLIKHKKREKIENEKRKIKRSR